MNDEQIRLKQEALLAFESNDYRRARELLRKAIDYEDIDISLLTNLSAAEGGEIEEHRRLLLERYPSSFLHAHGVANARTKFGIASAVDACSHALKLGGESERLRALLGRVLAAVQSRRYDTLPDDVLEVWSLTATPDAYSLRVGVLRNISRSGDPQLVDSLNRVLASDSLSERERRVLATKCEQLDSLAAVESYHRNEVKRN